MNHKMSRVVIEGYYFKHPTVLRLHKQDEDCFSTVYIM
ncbi:hypothetical protein BMEGG_06340 [Priestia megaterium]